MGAVDNYFYRHLAGINFDSKDPGFRKIILKPNFVAGIEFARASYHSIHGEIASGWKLLENGKYEYRVSVPPNCKAELSLPGKKLELGSGDHTVIVNL
ncbi:MAG: hypothetical protein IH594_11055 [Bacteroidales bacterium]|nr:hypothetical protein [Bacteroidales bacterium]